jgi:hypothetical protein
MPENVEFTQNGEIEISAGKSRARVMSGNIIHVTSVGTQSTEEAIELLKATEKLTKLCNGKVSFLIDLNLAGKNSPGARRLWKEEIEHEHTCKVALYGIHPVAKVLASFVMTITSSHNIRFFKTFEKGLKWLQE